ncbi:DegV family protein [Adlercreutzia sp. ZJ304]|uniref:DegV family protein n=1 Tax=unclassified Adlercreutzia TaxID=2636013 RepID=UPI0032176819
MRRCNLIVDSCCDLPVELLNREGVTLLKFPYIVGERTFEDDMFQTLGASDFYDAMRKGAQPSTSQLSVPVLTTAFEAAAEDGTPTVYLSFTSGLSGSFSVAEMVRDQVLSRHEGFELYLVDTRLASIAEGVVVFEAINQMEKGLTAEELAQWASEARYFVDCEFMVDDLDTLQRGGRIPSSVAVAGAALDVKPMLTIDTDGTLKLVGVARGRKKGIKQLAEYYAKHVDFNGRGNYVMVGNTDCEKDMARLCDSLNKGGENPLIIKSSIGPVIGSHVGPGMLAIAFWGSDQRENMSVADRIANRIRKAE